MTTTPADSGSPRYLLASDSQVPIGSFRQYTTDQFTFSIDYSDWLASSGELVNTATVSVFPGTTSPLVISGITLSIAGQVLTGPVPPPNPNIVFINGGLWDATANNPPLQSSTGVAGEYYTVGVAGALPLDGNSAWNVGDVALFDGAVWRQVLLSNAVVGVTFTNLGGWDASGGK